MSALPLGVLIERSLLSVFLLIELRNGRTPEELRAQLARAASWAAADPAHIDVPLQRDSPAPYPRICPACGGDDLFGCARGGVGCYVCGWVFGWD